MASRSAFLQTTYRSWVGESANEREAWSSPRRARWRLSPAVESHRGEMPIGGRGAPERHSVRSFATCDRCARNRKRLAE